MKERILIIEDEASLARVLRSYLEREGFEVITAARGDTGYDLSLTEKVDLILLDLNLPDHFVFLREHFPELIRVDGPQDPPGLPVKAIVFILGDLLLDGEDEILWQEAREFSWRPADAVLVKVPLTPGRIAAADPDGSVPAAGAFPADPADCRVMAKYSPGWPLCLAVGYPTALFIARRRRPTVRMLLLFLVLLPFWTGPTRREILNFCACLRIAAPTL